jgi:hypothetical protein
MEFSDMFLSPLGKEYCYLYYILMVFSLINLFIGGLLILKNLIESNKKDNVKNIFGALVGGSVLVVEYILSRLIYSMCVKAL